MELDLVTLTQGEEPRDSSSSTCSSSDGPHCRICLESGGEDLIAPCQCRGTQKFVHRACLDCWRAHPTHLTDPGAPVQEGVAFSQCSECRTPFQMIKVSVQGRYRRRWLPKLQFKLLVCCNHAAIFVAVQATVLLLGLLLYRLYGQELKEMLGYDEHPYAFYSLAASVLLLVGLLYGLFVGIICAPRIHSRHYHVLSRQREMTTEEYVVQGLA